MNQFSTVPHFHSAQDAFVAIIKAILEKTDWVEPSIDATSVGSRFGKTFRRTKELLCAGFAITNPRARLIDCPPRRIDLAFAFANFIWTLGGNNDVPSISFYNPKGIMFSDDGKHYAGALGHRMQSTKSGSQLEAVVNILKNDPASRRAVIQFYSDTDSILRPRDTPCIIAMHFLLRHGKLSAIVNMRSQSALMVMPYDIVLYTMLHELVAADLNVELGTYYHFSDSLHIYDDEMEMASAVLSNQTIVAAPEPMARMPNQPMQIVGAITSAERLLREQNPLTEAFTGHQNLQAYWRDIMTVLLASVLRRKGPLATGQSMGIHTHYKRWFNPNDKTN